MSLTARCACGALTATVPGPPQTSTICHCAECKRRTGAAFSWNARWPEEAVEIEGDHRAFTRPGEDGEVTHHFCPVCGVAVFYRLSLLPGFLAIPLGTFADPALPPPSRSIYIDRQVPWVEITARPLVED